MVWQRRIDRVSIHKKIESARWVFRNDDSDFGVEVEVTYTGKIHQQFIEAYDETVHELREALKEELT